MWTLLRTVKCWEAYQKETATTLGVLGLPIEWGKGPKEYPALVSTYMPPTLPGQPPRLVSAYVFRGDAEILLKAAGVDPAVPVAQPVAKAFPSNRVVWMRLTPSEFLTDPGIRRALLKL